MLYSCTHMATVGVKGLNRKISSIQQPTRSRPAVLGTDLPDWIDGHAIDIGLSSKYNKNYEYDE